MLECLEPPSDEVPDDIDNAVLQMIAEGCPNFDLEDGEDSREYPPPGTEPQSDQSVR
jgi:hypothetical protein